MLDLSTAHVTPQTRLALTDGIESVISYAKGGWGWFVLVPDSDETSAETPADLLVVLQYAKQQGIDWVMLDSDGPICEQLPVYSEELDSKPVDSKLSSLAAAYANHLFKKFGKPMDSMVTPDGRIGVRERDQNGNGMYTMISAAFAHSIVFRPLPVVDQPVATNA